MATLLSDAELAKLIGTVLVNGDAACIRPNSYVLRLGSEGEFINTGKDFTLGDRGKKGIKVQPGHSVGVTAFETIDFRRETVRKLYPDHDLHALISPTTDLSREGIVAPTTQVDAGYFGTLNWTLTNTSSEERRFVYGERLFRLTIFKLAPGETPDALYEGDYQSQTGYVRSQRQGAPVGMKTTDWEDAHTKGGPEDLLDNLIKSGYPWHLLGQKLKVIDQQFKSVTEEYSSIHDALGELTGEVGQLRARQNEVSDTVRRVVRDETSSLQNRWLIGAGSLLVGTLGLILSVTSNPAVTAFIMNRGMIIGTILIGAAAGALYMISRKIA
jgi:deoxycytidine triphosphate deaminase